MKSNPKPDFLASVARAARRHHVTPYLVGGPVRDSLLNRPCHDWDFVSQKAHSLSRSVARTLRAKLIVLDEQNRIYRVILKKGETTPLLTLDFAEMQGQTIERDLKRRDFTINAMAQALDQTSIIDLFGGHHDLQKKIIRAVSRKAFQDDPLRILRTFRFAAQFGFSIDPQTLRWVKAHQTLLGSHPGGVARERVREELLKLLSQPNSGPFLISMDTCGLLTTLFPAMEAGRRVGMRYYGKGGVVKHALQAVVNLEWIFNHLSALAYLNPAPVRQAVKTYINQPLGGHPRATFLKLGALLHDIGKPATAQVIRGRLRFFGHEEIGADIARKTTEQLRFSRQETQAIRSWVQNHMRPGNLAAAKGVTDKAMARFFRDLGEDGLGMLLVSLGDHYTYLARSRWGKGKDSVEATTHRLLERYCLQREKVLPARLINGHALMKKLRLQSGPLIGKLLDLIQDAQAEGKVKTPGEALGWARKAISRLKLAPA